jgi:hypothetical protein
MKYAMTMFFATLCVGCSHYIDDYAPSKFTLSPSTEWEIQDGAKTKIKPKIQTSMDWIF